MRDTYRLLFWIILTTVFGLHSEIYAKVLEYPEVLEKIQESGQQMIPRQIRTKDGEGVLLLGQEDTLYAAGKELVLRETPEEAGEEAAVLSYGTAFTRTAVCENGWSQGTVVVDGQEYTGFLQNADLSEEMQLEAVQEENIKVLTDVEVMDFPARKEGIVVGELLEDDLVMRTGVIQDVWSQIYFQADGEEIRGYVPSYSLDVKENASKASISDQEDGSIHESEGTGVFAEAIDGVTQEIEGDMTVPVMGQAGVPVPVSAGDVLKSMGVFRITHYCTCPICCGSYANGITATGTVCTTNRTIAVNPNQIPYGTKVVIGGQVYVAEDCGGAIGTNCIDIYVGTHAEGLQRGTYNTEVYIIVE